MTSGEGRPESRGEEGMRGGGRPEEDLGREERDALALCRRAADAVAEALGPLGDRHAPGDRPGQYRLDLVADAAALAVLEGGGVAVWSEESGPPTRSVEGSLLAVLDPVDGSTNASRGLPLWATSIALVDRAGVWCALVQNQVTKERFTALRGRGAWRDGRPIGHDRWSTTPLDGPVLAVNGRPVPGLRSRQWRALGSAALELAWVAGGALDGYVDCSAGLFPWDYLGALLVCREAGVLVADVEGRDLERVAPGERRRVVAGSPGLVAEAVEVLRKSVDASPAT
jgi:myo-inositol-1(or 4)-monophosphatase